MRVSLAVVVLAACGPGDRDNPSVDALSQGDAATTTDAPPAVDTSRVFAHVSSDAMGQPEGQPDRLYRLNAMLLSPIEVGPITGLDHPDPQIEEHLLDLAIDNNDRMFGVTATRIFTLDAQTGAATYVADLPAGSFFSSLSFVQQDPNDPQSPDILVTAGGNGDVLQIDTQTGAATVIGNYGMKDGKQIRSSGDLFGVRGFGPTGIYATVDLEGETEDYLATIDPANGWKATILGSGTGFDKIFGLGFWNGRIYGFVDEGYEMGSGKVIEIDPTTGIGAVKNSGAFRWFGAGVATDAPIL